MTKAVWFSTIGWGQIDEVDEQRKCADAYIAHILTQKKCPRAIEVVKKES